MLNELRTDFYVYQHRRMDTQSIFYVGRGMGFRAASKTNRNIYWNRVVNKTTYQIEYIVKNVTKEFADLCEFETINLYKRKNIKLTNMTEGGDGSASGISPSELTRQKISIALKNKKKTAEHCKNISLGQQGRFITEETKKKMSEAQILLRKRVVHPRLGSKQSEEAKQAMSKAKLGKPRNVLASAKIVDYLNGTFFITNGIKSKRIKGDFVLPFGWYFGKTAHKLQKADK
jgi:hypothetical protein